MLFAYLTEYPRRDRAGLALDQLIRTNDGEPPINPVALTKARTLLWWLRENNQLTVTHTNGWVIFTGPERATALVHSNVSWPKDANIVAVVPAQDVLPAWEQPGIAFVKDYTKQRLLFDNWLDQSGRWMKRHPNKLLELERFAA